MQGLGLLPEAWGEGWGRSQGGMPVPRTLRGHHTAQPGAFSVSFRTLAFFLILCPCVLCFWEAVPCLCPGHGDVST